MATWRRTEGTFIAINGIVTSSDQSLAVRANILVGVVVVIALFVPIFLKQVHHVTNFGQLLVCTATFPLWAISINPIYVADFLNQRPETLQLYVSVLTVLVATCGPLFLRGSSDEMQIRN